LKRSTRWRSLATSALATRRKDVTGAVLVCVAILLLLSRVFSVSCSGAEPCVTLAELRDGAFLPEAAHLFDQNGELIAEVAGPLRRTLAAEEIPLLLADAFVAVEDRRFWEHGGVDALGVVRAALRNVRAGEIEEGASTIPMQLVRTLWAESLRDMGPWRRKIIEARTAPRLIGDLGHERVLLLYLNAIYLGNGIYGVERAAEHYFGTGVDSLTLGQLATLVGMTRAPELYDPRRHPERAREVRDVVLRTLADEGLITASEAESASRDLELAPLDSTLAERRRRTHLSAAVLRELRDVAPELAGRPGLRIHTTIDSRVQEEGTRAVEVQLAAIESGRYGPLEEGDSLAPLEAAAVALEPRTGAVLAWIGGRDFARSEFDRVEQGRRQVGSLVKPLLVATALEAGYGITDMVSADTVPIQTDRGPWLPADHVQETALPLREALVRSSNRAAAHLGESLGLEHVARLAERGGLGDPIPVLPSSAIGAFDASLLDVTAAYSAFGNGGVRVEPHLIRRIHGPDDSILWVRPDTQPPQRAMDERTAFVVLDAMRAVVDRGTGYQIRAAGYWGPAAGKTGTTNEGRDAWFVGLTPGMVAGIWIGYDRPGRIVQGRGGGDLAAPSWGAWMRALERTPRFVRAAWIPPSGVERVRYEEATGRVVSLGCDVQLGVGYHEAWVHEGRYERGGCGADRGWLRRLWRGIVPLDPQPVVERRNRPRRR
jgi:penicillin-binding protein 1A